MIYVFTNSISDMTNQERKNEIDIFNDHTNKAMFLVASIRTGALGLNLQAVADKVCMLAFPENIGLIIQIIRRVHRIG